MSCRKYPELEGRVALVTGSSRGIGRAIAVRLAREGARVVVNCRSSTGAAEAVVREIEDAGGEARLCVFDIADAEAVKEGIEELVKELGAIHILVNNAGVTSDNLLLRMKEEEWEKVVKINLAGTFNCTKAVLRGMIKQRYGRIINITSVVGEMGNAGQANYAASKGGIIAFTKSVAREVASRNITVNAVSPGFITTDMTSSLPEDVKSKMLESIPMGRYGEPEEVAAVVAFLASDEASYITGEVIRINGGLYM